MPDTVANSPNDSADKQLSDVVSENRTLFILLGVIFILAGIFGIAAPFATTVVAKLFLGWLFIFTGISQIVHAACSPNWKGTLGNTLMALLYLLAGIWLAFFPLTGILELTVFLAILFVVEGISKIIIAVRVRPQDGWIWMLASAVISLVIGFLILNRFPSSAIWAIGLLVGSNILMSGLAFLMIVFSVGKRDA